MSERQEERELVDTSLSAHIWAFDKLALLVFWFVCLPQSIVYFGGGGGGGSFVAALRSIAV